MATNTFQVAKVTLAAAVANAGTLTVAYPSGTAQADFTGPNANTADEIVIVNDNDRWGNSKVDISYGASNVTVTNNSGVTWPAGANLTIQLAQANRNRISGPKAAAITKPTNDTTGTKAAIDAVIDVLKAAGLTA